jgi:hypothetical protein
MLFDQLKRRELTSVLGGAMSARTIATRVRQSAKKLRVALFAILTLLPATLTGEAQQPKKNFPTLLSFIRSGYIAVAIAAI